jgi:ElaB/YqjD/DUF883 family membrane-anchored ribosome-binding protein
MTMESTVAGNFARTTQASADKATDKVQGAGDAFSSKVADVHNQARDAAAKAADSIMSYTKKNPATALAIAAASGVVLYAAIRALRSSRD